MNMCFRRKKENKPIVEDIPVSVDEIREEKAKVVTMEDSDFSEKSLEGFYKVTVIDDDDEVAYAYVYQPHDKFWLSKDNEVSYYIRNSANILSNGYEISHSRLEDLLKNAQPATREDYISDLKRRFEKIKDKFYQMKTGDVYYSFSPFEHHLFKIESVYKVVDYPVSSTVSDDMMIIPNIIPYNNYRVLYRQKEITDKDYGENIISVHIIDFLSGKKEGTGIEYQA